MKAITIGIFRIEFKHTCMLEVARTIFVPGVASATKELMPLLYMPIHHILQYPLTFQENQSSFTALGYRMQQITLDFPIQRRGGFALS